MNLFDWAVVAVLAASALVAFGRGIVRSLLALVAWVVGLVAAIAWAPQVGAALPRWTGHPLVPYVVAFVLIFVAVLVAGALIAWPLRALIHGAGLGFLDRGLGALFGVARGAVILIAFALAAGLTTFPSTDWWQNSLFAPRLAAFALELRPWLPRAWAERLDYSGRGGLPTRSAPANGKV